MIAAGSLQGKHGYLVLFSSASLYIFRYQFRCILIFMSLHGLVDGPSFGGLWYHDGCEGYALVAGLVFTLGSWLIIIFVFISPWALRRNFFLRPFRPCCLALPSSWQLSLFLNQFATCSDHYSGPQESYRSSTCFFFVFAVFFAKQLRNCLLFITSFDVCRLYIRLSGCGHVFVPLARLRHCKLHSLAVFLFSPDARCQMPLEANN